MKKKFRWLAPLFCLMLLFGVRVLAADEQHTPPLSGEIETVYAIDQKNQTYHAIPKGDWERVRAALTLPVRPALENTAAKDVGGFCFVDKGGGRTLYTITDSQVLVGDTPLMASIFQRQSLEQLSASLCAANPAQPAMLAYMNLAKVTKITAKGSGQSQGRIDPEKPLDFSVSASSNREQVQAIAAAVKGLRVTPNATEFPAQTPAPDTNDRTLFLSMEFSTGTRYDMTVSEEGLLLRSSDGVRTYRYLFAGYDPHKPSSSPIWGLRDCLWEEYAGGASCVAAGVFLTKTGTRERVAGTFYSVQDGGEIPLADLSHVVDNILAAKPLPTIVPAGKTFVELYVELGETGEQKRFELDESLNAYYLNSAGRGVSVAVSREDWDTVRALLNGGHDTERLMLKEKGEAYRLMSLKGTEQFLEPLFNPLPKAAGYQPYNTGPKPDYAVNGIHCWTVRDGSLTESTVYPEVLVQQSNLLPWTPAEYNAAQLYKLLDFQ